MRTLRTMLALLLLCAAAQATEPITIFLAGDSTMAQKLPEKRPETGWGEELQHYFDPAQVRIDNRAKNGRSTRTFISEGLWDGILHDLKAGDYVFIQFGHNDESKEKTDRYTPPDDFKQNLARFVRDVRAKQATPILLTPVRRRKFDRGGALVDTHGEYPDLVRTVARDLRVTLIDMHELSAAVLQQYGDRESRKLFLQLAAGENPNYPQGIEDNTHFSPVGAGLMAECAIKAMRDQKLPLAKFLPMP